MIADSRARDALRAPRSTDNPGGLAAAALCALLSACGGSSGGGPAPVPPPPAPPPPVGGLDARLSNETCLAPSRTEGTGTAIELEVAFPGVGPFSQPLALLQAPGDPSRWFVLEKGGRVRVFGNDPAVASLDPDFIDLAASFPGLNTASEGGLLGMAFDPRFADNGRVYLSWTEGTPMVSVVARFTSLDGGRTLDAGSRSSDVIRINQDYDNHNGGQIAFGPDGYLYLGLGDGGSGGDPKSRAQDTTNLLGAMLRLDVSAPSGYGIPPTNPFAGNALCPADHSSTADCPEIFAWGLRNPWRWSFDRATGELWAGDVGQGTREEIDRIERGGNYGWNCREGSISYPGAQAPSCPTTSGFIEPIHDYGRGDGGSVTGGYVYRGSALPALVGSYVFGDFSSGRIWRLGGDGAGGYVREELLGTALAISSFGESSDGELYVVDLYGGRVHRVVAADGGALDPEPVPALLSETGCVNPQSPALPAAPLVPYEIAAPFWSDGAGKERWFALPDGTTIAVGADGDFDFPPGSVLMKHFRLGGRLIETRLLMRHPDGGWAGYSYAWNAQGTDATLVGGGATADIDGQQWVFPSGNDCMVCHTAAAGFALGAELAEINRNFLYPATGREANQIESLGAVGYFAAPLGAASAYPALADPFDPAAPLGDRARAYLHTNCSQCHRPEGPTQSALDLRAHVGLGQMNACNVPPQLGDLGLGAEARIIAPGAPDLSVLLERVERRDAAGMPPLGSTVVDADGAALLSEWIASLTVCQ